MGNLKIFAVTVAACLFAGGLAQAQPGPLHFGLIWGQSRQEALDAGRAKVLSRALHQRYGLALEVDQLPSQVGDEIHRILYFDDEDRLLRVWIDFGHPEGRVWAENYLLDEAVAKYQNLKAAYKMAGTSCVEPELRTVEEDGRTILDRAFVRNGTVWACEDERGPTQLKISMRRLGDTAGERFDVIYDAQDRRAVAAYRNLHRLHTGDE